jgi:hypothetical protein
VKKTQNGRLAYQLLYAHYMGPNNVVNMAGEAENVLTSAHYDGERRYALMHLRQHLILEALMAHGYVGIDPRSKVRFLLTGIRCSTLDAVKTRICSDESLRSNFARCVTLFKDFVKQTAQTTNAQLRIAAMSVTDGGGKSKGGRQRKSNCPPPPLSTTVVCHRCHPLLPPSPSNCPPPLLSTTAIVRLHQCNVASIEGRFSS